MSAVDHVTVKRRARKKRIRTRKSRRQLTSNSNREADNHHDLDTQQCQLFIGQLPSSADERDLRALLEPFGEISRLKLCRDKDTGFSQRCCFVTFLRPLSALMARQALHNVSLSPQMSRPLQVKSADHHVQYKHRKIFIGNISRQLTEVDLTNVFGSFGEIEDCTIIREHNGQSKGSALITYVNNISATTAIRAMHQSCIIPGCQTPIIVRLADSKYVKMLKKQRHQLPQNMSGAFSQISKLSSTHHLADQPQQTTVATRQPSVLLNNHASVNFVVPLTDVGCHGYIPAVCAPMTSFRLKQQQPRVLLLATDCQPISASQILIAGSQ